MRPFRWSSLHKRAMAVSHMGKIERLSFLHILCYAASPVYSAVPVQSLNFPHIDTINMIVYLNWMNNTNTITEHCDYGLFCSSIYLECSRPFCTATVSPCCSLQVFQHLHSMFYMTDVPTAGAAATLYAGQGKAGSLSSEVSNLLPSRDNAHTPGSLCSKDKASVKPPEQQNPVAANVS